MNTSFAKLRVEQCETCLTDITLQFMSTRHKKIAMNVRPRMNMSSEQKLLLVIATRNEIDWPSNSSVRSV